MNQDEVLFVIAEFERAGDVVRAAAAATQRGYRRVEAYTPYPVEGLAEALEFRQTRVPLVALVGAIVGGCAGFALAYWVSVIQYPLNIGGRPLNSWPMFVPVTFECVILGAALCCVFGMLVLNGLPRLYHPVFDAAGFERASSNRFFLCIEATDPQFEPVATRQFLEALKPVKVSDVAKSC